MALRNGVDVVFVGSVQPLGGGSSTNYQRVTLHSPKVHLLDQMRHTDLCEKMALRTS